MRRCAGKTNNYGADLPVARSFDFYSVRSLELLLGLLWLSVAGLLVDMNLLADLLGLLRLLELLLLNVLVLLEVLVLLRVLMRLRVLVLVRLRLETLLLLRGLGTTEALFFVDADLLFDVGVVVARGVDSGGEGFVGLFLTFPSV